MLLAFIDTTFLTIIQNIPAIIETIVKMEKVEQYKLGAFCVQRMSLQAQQELRKLTEKDSFFTDTVLSELNEIERGRDFIKA